MKIVHIDQLSDEKISHSPKIKKRVFIKKGQVPYITNFSQATFKTGQIASELTHPNLFMIFLVESGSGLIKVDGKVNQIKEGHCILVEPGEAHEIINTSANDLLITYFGVEKKPKAKKK